MQETQTKNYYWRIPVEFFVPGVPKPGGSKRAFVNPKTGQAIITDACKKNKQWRDSVAAAAIEAYQGQPLIGLVGFQMDFYFARPRGHFGTGKNAAKLKSSAPPAPPVKPDLTKVIRSTEDALTRILWRDDSQVIAQWNSKSYVGLANLDHLALPSVIPGVRVTLMELVRRSA